MAFAFRQVLSVMSELLERSGRLLVPHCQAAVAGLPDVWNATSSQTPLRGACLEVTLEIFTCHPCILALTTEKSIYRKVKYLHFISCRFTRTTIFVKEHASPPLAPQAHTSVRVVMCKTVRVSASSLALRPSSSDGNSAKLATHFSFLISHFSFLFSSEYCPNTFICR